MSDARWTELLDSLETTARDWSAAGDGNEPPAFSTTDPFDPPDGLGPLPRELRARAEAIVDQLEASTAALGARLDALRAEMARVERPRRAMPQEPERRGGFETRV